ncbi:PAS domain S-box protein [bacterium]|nr:PAS domain S-box protein [bacterium]
MEIENLQDQEKLRQELRIKNTAISNSAMPFAFSDFEGNLTYVNDAYVRLWGYDSQEEVVGRNNREFSSTEEEVSAIMDAIRNKGSWSGEATAIKKNGTPFDVYLSASLIYDEKGDPISMQGSFIDITKRKKTEKINRDIFRIVDESLNEIFIFDANNLHFVQVNKGARENLGYSWKELQQITPVDIKPEFDKASFFRLIDPLVSGAKEKVEFTTVHKRKDNTTYPVEVHVQYSTFGSRPVFVAIILDIALRKKNENLLLENQKQVQEYSDRLEKKVAERTQKLLESEARLRRALTKERELGELKSRFVSMASHEFRTPLSSILSSAGLIRIYQEKGMPEKQLKHIDRIQSSVNSLTSILNDFLSLEKLESGTINFHPQEVNFVDFFEEVKEEFQPFMQADQLIHLEYVGEENVSIDTHLVKNIFFNLLSNAVKYSPIGKEVAVYSEKKGDQLVIEVTDYGMGIPEADQKHMFSRFFRATNVTNVQGTGLGLTIVKRYLDLMRGDISFTSELGKGTTFRVQIPMGVST